MKFEKPLLRASTLGARGYLLFFFLRAKRASNAAKPRQRGAKRREKNNLSRLPSEPAKRLIFSPTIRQRASGTRVASLKLINKIDRITKKKRHVNILEPFSFTFLG